MADTAKAPDCGDSLCSAVHRLTLPPARHTVRSASAFRRTVPLSSSSASPECVRAAAPSCIDPRLRSGHVTHSLDTEPVPKDQTRFDRIAERIENGALVLTMAVLVGVATSQFILRAVFNSTLEWADEFQRIVVLWLALLGAVAAARTDRHLRIDVAHKLLGPRLRELVSAVASLVVVVVAATLAYEAGRFTAQAYSFGDTVMDDVEQWPFLVIMPIAFGLIALYYLRNAVRQTLRAIRGVDGSAG